MTPCGSWWQAGSVGHINFASLCRYDSDGNGAMDQIEITSALVQLGIDMSEEEASTLIVDYDTDGNGLCFLFFSLGCSIFIAHASSPSFALPLSHCLWFWL